MFFLKKKIRTPDNVNEQSSCTDVLLVLQFRSTNQHFVASELGRERLTRDDVQIFKNEQFHSRICEDISCHQHFKYRSRVVDFICLVLC